MSTEVKRRPVDEVVAGLRTKSDKIRALTAAGYSRTEIADYLGIRYQHVRNVQIQDERVGRSAPSIQPAIDLVKKHSAPSEKAELPIKRFVENGFVELPDVMRTALGIKDGDPVILTLEEDGIRLVSLPVAIKRAQAMVRRYVPEGVNLVDELIAERRAEARRENGGE
jgi:bifunctional DNA-binding transcriptional regulator/antitoxin component of YhaV-PrlF toxin-antitoxin module